MRATRSAPIGRVWTVILRVVAKASMITTEGVAVALRPLAPGQLWPSRQDLGYVSSMLTRMELLGYVRRSHPWTPGKLWAVGEEGQKALDGMGKRRRYRTSYIRRLKSKHRRDVLMQRGLCLNGEGHGKATHGRRCEPCSVTHRMSA